MKKAPRWNEGRRITVTDSRDSAFLLALPFAAPNAEAV